MLIEMYHLFRKRNLYGTRNGIFWSILLVGRQSGCPKSRIWRGALSAKSIWPHNSKTRNRFNGTFRGCRALPVRSTWRNILLRLKCGAWYNLYSGELSRTPMIYLLFRIWCCSIEWHLLYRMGDVALCRYCMFLKQTRDDWLGFWNELIFASSSASKLVFHTLF